MIRQLEYFVALAREQHFAQGARVCFVSQPALSEAIRKLEDELGVPLVRRGHSFQGLTPEGEAVLIWARKILSDSKALRDEAGALQAGLRGTLRLGVVPAASSTVVNLTDGFARLHPEVHIQLETSLRSADIIRRVRNFELDAGLVYAVPEEFDDMLVQPLYSEEHVLLTKAGMLEPGVTSPDWSTALSYPLCLLDGSMRGRQVLDAALSTQGLVATPRIECDSVVSLLSHVATGNWASIVPRQWLEPLGPLPGIVQSPLRDPAVTSTISLIVEGGEPRPLMTRALLSLAETTFLHK